MSYKSFSARQNALGGDKPDTKPTVAPAIFPAAPKPESKPADLPPAKS